MSSSWIRVGLAVLLIGWAIKLMDDHVDREIDLIMGRPNLAHRLGDGVSVYMAWAAVMAVYLAPTTAATLFLAAYAVGMGDQLGERYRTGWRAWVEVAASLLIGALVDLRLFILNLILMVTIQMVDDLVDIRHDHMAGRRTVVAQVGPGLTVLAIVSLVLVALHQSPWYTIWVMASALVIAVLAEKVGTP